MKIWKNITIKFKEIAYGVFFFVFRDSEVEKVAIERKKKCGTCPMNSTVMKKMDSDFKPWRKDEYCLECQCNLKLKQRSLKSACPNKLW